MSSGDLTNILTQVSRQFKRYEAGEYYYKLFVEVAMIAATIG